MTKLIRITALLLRFVHNCKTKQLKHIGFLTTAELNHSHIIIIKLAQQTSFTTEISLLTSNKQLSLKNKLSSLTPFIDKDGVMKVGGRLDNADITYQQKHPIILSGNHKITRLIVHQYHLQHLHANKRLLYYLLHRKYWIISATQTIKEILYKCSICMRHRAKTLQQQMGNLPSNRLNPAPVFANVGIDYAGPIQVLEWKGRGKRLHKSWIAIFVCLTVKAVHIELVSELTTAAFIAALRRFIARRGKPCNIYSDNGTNFVGANNHLAELYDFLKANNNQDAIHRNLTDQEIKWHFSPPSGPHFGGLWEAGVKSIKHHLNRVLKTAHPTFEELTTILCQIEMCLNSRPLCIKYEEDLDPLTPGHFILLRPMATIPDENTHAKSEKCLTRWQYVQRLVREFWRKWSNEYLHQMQQRPKWRQKMKTIAEGDVVIIKDDNLAPTYWLMGKIIRVHPGSDGLIRVATIKTSTGEIKRPISKLCPILVNG